MNAEDSIHFYTDGSADPKRKDGSWAYVRVKNETVVSESSGRLRKTDSARMEMLAVIEALKSLSSPSTVVIHTDCAMLIEAMIKFIPGWKANSWLKPRTNRAIPNVDLYRQLDELSLVHAIEWRWIKAHNGNPFNERCDELCRLARSPLRP